MSEKARLIDIAKALNISTTTVSRALNNKSDISPKTKEAVLALAKQMDYQPNNLAISLRKKRKFQSVGVIVPNVDHYFFSTVLRGIMNQAHTKNYMVMVGNSAENAELEQKIAEEFIQYGINGLLIAPGRKSNSKEILDLLTAKRIPLVLMDRTFPGYQGNFVLSDDFSGAQLATRHLFLNGFKRIAHIGSLDNCSVGMQRYSGYLASLEQQGIPFDETIIIECKVTNHEAGYKATQALFNLENPPDAVFTVTDDVAAGVLGYCNDHHISIPQDFGVVGYSNSEISSILKPKLTTIEQKGEHMGQMAFDFCIRSLVEKNDILQWTFASKLIVRESSVR